MYYGQLANLNWLWWVALVLAVAIVATVRHYRASLAFASAELLRQMVPMNWTSRIGSLLLSTLALLAIVVGLVDIRWGRVWRDVPQRGIEVMFVLDVSRSMLAEDTSPNRLERSKQYIKDMVEQMAGDRIGLVLFAGDVKRHMPLTNHYGDFVSGLDEIGPHNIDRGGSNLGEAIEVAAEAFLEKTSEHRAIVLFTDGEYHESEPIAAANKALAEHGTRIFTIGIGDAGAGSQIPNATRRGSKFMKHGGQTVVSKLNDSVLEQIALTTDGAYIPAGTKQVDMSAVYHQFIANIEEQDFESARVNSYVPRYQWFLGFALLMLLADIFLSAIRKILKPKPTADVAEDVAEQQVETPGTKTFATSAATIAILFCAFASEESFAEENAAALVQQGQAALAQGDASTAIEKFDSAVSLGYSDPRLTYNQGIAHYNAGDLGAARSAFAQAAESTDRTVAGQARYNIGNTYYAEALQGMQADPKAAMSSLATAIDHYRGALAANRGDEDARANIELAHRLKQQLQQQQEQQPQQNESQDNEQQEGSEQESEQKQSEEQNDEAQEKDQEQNNGDKEEQESKQQQDSESKGENEQNQDGSQGEGEQKGEQNQSESQKQEDGQQEQKNDQGETEPGEQSEGEQSEGENGEPPKDGKLEAANEQGEAAKPGAEGKEGPPMTMQEARKLLQAVRDRELRNRIEKLRRMRPRRVKVEKDW